jgi:cytochrome c-type biogenesis protein CcmE
MIAIAAGLVLVAVAAALVLNAFQGNVVFFFSPTQVASGEAPVAKTFRIGGMVEKGSVKRLPDGVTVQFIVTDTAKNIPVTYSGILPDLFKEGKGVVAQGRLNTDGTFRASEVLAKHDENYMPPEAAHALSKAEADKAARSVVTPGVVPSGGAK